MHGWVAADRTASATVGTPAAVATLFATAYAHQPLDDRGCTSSFLPIQCTWGPFGGGSGSIYQISVEQSHAGWYVTAVVVES
jgi:hypothetical protein